MALDLMTLQEVADACRVTPDRVSRWIAAGRLAAIALGGGRTKRVRRADLEAFLVAYEPDPPSEEEEEKEAQP
jgi:excisionase family DNA binding protein